MRALFVSEEPQQDAPEKMSGLLQDFKAKSERRRPWARASLASPARMSPR